MKWKKSPNHCFSIKKKTKKGQKSDHRLFLLIIMAWILYSVSFYMNNTGAIISAASLTHSLVIEAEVMCHRSPLCMPVNLYLLRRYSGRQYVPCLTPASEETGVTISPIWVFVFIGINSIARQIFNGCDKSF